MNKKWKFDMNKKWKFDSNGVSVVLYQNAKKQLILNIKIGPLKEKICVADPEVILKFKQFISLLEPHE